MKSGKDRAGKADRKEVRHNGKADRLKIGGKKRMSIDR